MGSNRIGLDETVLDTSSVVGRPQQDSFLPEGEGDVLGEKLGALEDCTTTSTGRTHDHLDHPPLDEQERRLAEAAASVIEEAERAGLSQPPHALGITTEAFRLLARAYIELREQVRELHELVDQTDPNDSIGVALTKVGLAQKPSVPGRAPQKPRIVPTPEEISKLDVDALLAIYCRVMGEAVSIFTPNDRYVVRVWDGMDGCWTNCTGEVGRDEALRYWAERTDCGTRHVAYAEIGYYRIFPAGSRMQFDGSEEGREMHR